MKVPVLYTGITDTYLKRKCSEKMTYIFELSRKVLHIVFHG
jgi:hypothetical protein